MIACLDLEGVLIPEIWINVAERTGIDALRATTRDIPDYDVLMTQRLAILREHGLGIREIQEVIDTMDPLPGAAEMLDWLRENEIPHTVVATKSDKVKSSKRPARKRDLAEGCQLDPGDVVWVSSTKGDGIERLRDLVRLHLAG